jgi:hypothetical protein
MKRRILDLQVAENTNIHGCGASHLQGSFTSMVSVRPSEALHQVGSATPPDSRRLLSTPVLNLEAVIVSR